MKRIDGLIDRLTLLEADRGPFPYEGCRTMVVADRERYREFAMDLAHYMAELAGYRSWGRKILGWPDDKVKAVSERLAFPFFERHTEYADLAALLGEPAAHDVRGAMDNIEQTRSALRELLEAVAAARASR